MSVPTSVAPSAVTSANEGATKFIFVKSIAGLNRAIADARGRAVLVDFYADWCTSCKHLDADVFDDPAVQGALKNLVLIRVDVTANDEDSKALETTYNVVAPPTVLFFNKNGQWAKDQTLVGDITKTTVLQSVNQLK